MFFFLGFCRVILAQTILLDAPAPTLPPASHIGIVFDCGGSKNFDLIGNSNGIGIRTSYNGYETRLRHLGLTSSSASHCQSMTLERVSFHTTYSNLSHNAVVVVFKIENSGDFDEFVDLEVNGDLFFDTDDEAPVLALDEGRGFIVYSHRYAMTILARQTPLVHDVSTYWFGHHDYMHDFYWEQTFEPSAYGFDTAIAWSWQGIFAPAHETITRSVIAMFGYPYQNELTFSVEGEFPIEVLLTDVITIPCFVTSSRPDADVKVILVLDDDQSRIYELAHSVPNDGETFELSFHGSILQVGAGAHLFSFYAVDSIGTVSVRHDFISIVIFPTHSPSRSIPRSHTPSRSETALPTESRRPAPSVPPTQAIRLLGDCVSQPGANFDLRAYERDNSLILTSFAGYATSFRMGSSHVYIPRCQKVVEDGVSIVTNLTNISPNTVLITFDLVNGNANVRKLDLEVDADVRFDGLDEAPMAQLSGGRGFIMYSSRHIVTFLCHHSPLVSDVSTYWFGAHTELADNYWNQVYDDYIYGLDSTLAFSWQNVSIPAHGLVTKSVLVKTGLPDVNQLGFAIYVDSIPPTIGYHASFVLRGLVSSINDHANVSLIMVVDGDLGTIYRVASNVRINLEFEINFSPGGFGVLGHHRLSLYATDEYGDVSLDQSFNLTVIGPTQTKSATLRPTRSHTPSKSALPSQSPIPPPTFPANRPIPIVIGPGSIFNWDVIGFDGFELVDVTYQGHGFNNRLRIGTQEGGNPQQLNPVTWHGVTLYTNVTRITSTTAIVSYRLVNANATYVSIDLGTDADIFFDGDDSAPARTISGQRGFVIYSHRHGFTFFGRGHPLVDNVTTYWFGDHAERSAHFWNQTQAKNFFAGDLAVSFSWQGIVISPHGSATRTAFVQFGYPDVNQLSYTANFNDIPALFGYHDTHTITGSVTSVNAYETVSVVFQVDSDPAQIHRVLADLHVSEALTIHFRPSDFGIAPGPHQLKFYAIDSKGTFSNVQMFATNIVAPTHSPSLTIPPTPTHPRSPLPTVSRTPLPPPPPTLLPSAPHLPIRFQCASQANFDIMGEFEGQIIRTSFSGYATRLRYGPFMPEQWGCQPLETGDFTMYVNLTQISPNTVLLSFRVVNHGRYESVVDISVSADVHFDGQDDAPVREIEGFRGMVVYSHRFALTFLGRGASLVNDVSTYWFGHMGSSALNYFTQVPYPIWWGDDTAMAFSWLYCLVPAGGSVTRSTMVMWGLPDHNFLTLEIDMTHVPDVVHGTDTISLPAVVSSVKTDEIISVLLVIDHDPFFMVELLTNLPALDAFQIHIVPSHLGVSPGEHSFTFYAVDTGGTVSNQQTFERNIISPTKSPSRTPLPSRTASRSRSALPTQSLAPPPTVPPSAPAVPIVIRCSGTNNFDLEGNISGVHLRTSFAGWGTQLRHRINHVEVGNDFVTSCRPLSSQGLVLYTNITHLSTNTVILNFKLVNSVATVHDIDLQIFVDLHFDDQDDPAVRQTDDRHGFIVYSHAHAMTVLVRNTSFVDDVTTFWFGRHSESSANAWKQVTDLSFYGHDSAMHFTWQNVSVGAHATVSRSAIVKLVGPSTDRLTFSPILTSIPSSIHSTETVRISGLISSVPANVMCSVLVVVDHNTSIIYSVLHNVPSNGEFHYDFTPHLFDINPGSHTFSLYVIDTIGTIAGGQSFSTLIIGPTQTIRATVRPTQTHSPLPTASRSRTLGVAPTIPPAVPIPVRVVCTHEANFEISGMDGPVHVPVTFHDVGFNTRLRIGSENSVTALACAPLSFHNVTLYTNVTIISMNAALMNFKVVNHNRVSTTVSWETHADIKFDQDDWAPVANLPDNQGFIIYSERHALTFIGRHYSLVNDVSSYWFGRYGDLFSHLWAQVVAEYVTGGDSGFVFTWQNITLAPGGIVSKSAIMKFGLPEHNHLMLEFEGQMPPTLWIHTTVDFWVFVTSEKSDEDIDLLLVLDDDTSMVYQITQDSPVNQEFVLVFRAARFNLTEGLHKFAFYAIDNIGTISSVFSFTTRVVNDVPVPSHTPTASVHATNHATNRATSHATSRVTVLATRSRSPLPTRTASHIATRHATASRPPPETPTPIPRTARPPQTRPRTPWPDPTVWVPPQHDEGDSGHVSPGGIAGIVVGILVLLGVAVVFIFWRRRQVQLQGGLQQGLKHDMDSVEDTGVEKGYTGL